MIWTDEDVRALAAGRRRPTVVEDAAADVAVRAPVSAGEPAAHGLEHNGKYRALWSWLRDQDRVPIRITFADLERRGGIVLPDSSRNHPPHWYGYQGSAVARAIIDAGWHASGVDLKVR